VPSRWKKKCRSREVSLRANREREGRANREREGRDGSYLAEVDVRAELPQAGHDDRARLGGDADVDGPLCRTGDDGSSKAGVSTAGDSEAPLLQPGHGVVDRPVAVPGGLAHDH
jgi:hypothetical protein